MNKVIPILVLLLTVTSLFAEKVPLFWDSPTEPIDSISIERSQDITTWASWTEIASLPSTATTYTDDVGVGIWHWRVVGVLGAERTDTISGTWKVIRVVPPRSLSTP